MNYKQAAEWIVSRRKRELDESNIIFKDALEHNPELYKTETELRGLLFDEAEGKKVDKKKITDLHKSKAAILQSIGLTESVLKPAPHCQKCGDTARTTNGYCDCVKTLALTDQKNLEIPCKSFSEIDYSRFDETSRDYVKSVYETVQKICEKYPGNKKRMIALLGATGTGKTLLAGSAATEIINRGFSAVAITAFGFVNRCLKYHTSFDDEKLSHLEPLLDADLLVIDDLGMESALKNITHEYLFNVLNERIVTGKLTVATTNLSAEGIRVRYGERIYSRLFDKESGYTVTFTGKDMRTDSK